ncbi:unnamed protein product [Adineta ricciae]|uniref:Uncharacterized protein n=1 Tax=Adineta ricciae TaxID=249248 RepID=A0A814CNB0_ADIRI|nr:unnamed protein product [Adineta ricciae]CAF1462621.1 unnamed protein product [Adineta ricciae]
MLYYIVIAWIFFNIFFINFINCDGIFYLQRVPLSCVETTITITVDNTLTDNCFIFSWQQIADLTTNYTTYQDPTTNQTFYARIAALTVLGTIDNHDLDYHCPPSGYNGVASGCSTSNNTHLVVLHINALDNKLYSINVILSGTPFPSPSSLVNNQPPFGTARHVFDGGISSQSSGYLKICKRNSSTQCPNTNTSAHALPYPLPSNTGYGIFGIKMYNFVTNSVWIMDDVNQILICTAGTTYYYFNSTGFFIYDYSSNTCTWSPACNYQCEVYNYNSRFLDYAGEWVITKKWGVGDVKPVAAQAWIGNAIDAAGIFPVILYTDNATGHYIGLDKLDPIPMSNMGASYWYTAHDDTIVGESVLKYHPNVVDVGCVSQLSDWTGPISDGEMIMTSKDIRLILWATFFLYFFVVWNE